LRLANITLTPINLRDIRTLNRIIAQSLNNRVTQSTGIA
jgi:hypothetical protein